MDTTLTPAATTTESRRRRHPGSPLALVGALLGLAEFVGIIATGVHTMPLGPGATGHQLTTTFSGQLGAIGFLVGWFSLTSSGRILFGLGIRREVRRARGGSSLADYAVLLLALTMVLELGVYAACAAASTAVSAHDLATAAAANTMARYLGAAFLGPGGLANLLLSIELFRSGTFPKVLAGLGAAISLVVAVAGFLLSAPGSLDLQESLTIVNLLGFPVSIAVGVVLLRGTRVPDAGTD